MMLRDNCGDDRLIDMSGEYEGEDNPTDIVDFYQSTEHPLSSQDMILYNIGPVPGIYCSIDTGYTDCIWRVEPLR